MSISDVCKNKINALLTLLKQCHLILVVVRTSESKRCMK